MYLKNHKNGFTLFEVLFAVIFVGLAIAALLAGNGAFTQANSTANEMSIAEFLTEQIRELTATLPVCDPPGVTWTHFGPETGETLATYDDVDDFDGIGSNPKIFSPPISADKTVLNDFSAFSQQITVENVSSSNFATPASDYSTPFVRVTVEIYHGTNTISSTSWIRARY